MNLFRRPFWLSCARGVALCSLVACDPDPNETLVHTRLTSPDHKLTAVYAEDISGGPATGVSEDVYVLDGDHPLRISDRVFTNECVENVGLAWEANGTLRISYDVGADIHEDTGYGGPSYPWTRPDHPPVHGIKVHLVRRVHPGGYC